MYPLLSYIDELLKHETLLREWEFLLENWLYTQLWEEFVLQQYVLENFFSQSIFCQLLQKLELYIKL